MDYLDIVNLVFSIITFILGIVYMHFGIFFIVGLFCRKKFKPTDEKLKYGLIIPARNEASVVGNLIESIQKNKYPQDKLQIFVIAHNCTDNTADICRKLGATVYEYNNPEECTMGYAFRYLFDRIKEDYGIKTYDGFFLFNADNILDEHYFDKMNDAFVARGKKDIITSYRNSKNFGSNVISAMYGIYFLNGCCFEARGRTVLGCSTRVQGTGYVINSDLVADGWKYVTLTEDWEFSVDQIIKGAKITYCNDAVFYDEQPTSVKIMLRQRLRWAKGHLLVFLTRIKDLLKGLFLPKGKGGCVHKGSLYDITANILPICVTLFILFFVQAGFTALAPLFTVRTASEVWLAWLDSFLRMIVGYYLSSIFSSILLLICEHKRIKGVGFFKLLFATILWPLFLFVSIPLEFVCLFYRNVGWKTIPHKDTTTFENLNQVSEGESAK